MVSSKDFSVLRSSSFFGASRNRVLWRSYCCSPITLLQVVAYSIVRVSSLQKMPILFQTGATEHSFGSLPALCLPSPGHYVGVKLGILYGSWPLYFFPALSWAGLLLTLVFLMQLGSAHNAFIRLLPFVALSIGANIFYQAPVLN